MKKKDLYKIVKEIIKEQFNPVDLETGLINIGDDGKALAPSKDRKEKDLIAPGKLSTPTTDDRLDPDIEGEVSAQGPNVGNPPSPTATDPPTWAGCGTDLTYTVPQMHNNDCNAAPMQLEAANVCCSTANAGYQGIGNHMAAGPMTVSAVHTLWLPTTPQTSVQLSQNPYCMCPNPIVDLSGYAFLNPNTGANPLNPNNIPNALMCCNCQIDKPWDPNDTGANNGNTSPASISSQALFTQQDYFDWLAGIGQGQGGITTQANDGRECAGCLDPAADNYQVDDNGTAGNTNIYGCAPGSVDGTTSNSWAGIESQTSANVGCCQYSGCMQYGATLAGSLAFKASTPLVTNINNFQPTSNQSNTGTANGANGLWTEDGSCEWEGCTWQVATNTGAISGQNTTLYPGSTFSNGANPPDYVEDNSCTGGQYGCPESTGNPDFAYNGGAEFDDGTACYGCPDPAMYNTYNGANTSNGFPALDCAGNAVQTPGDMTQGNPDVSCCTAVGAGCMDDGTQPALYEAGGANQNPNEARPASWNPGGTGTGQPACNYDAGANTEDNSCVYDECVGCTDIEFDPTSFNQGTGLSYTSTSGVLSGNYSNTYLDLTQCEFDGCIDLETLTGTGTNQVAIANSNYVCLVNPDFCDNNSPQAVLPLYANNMTDSNNACTYTLQGCTDPNSCTYNPDATVNDPAACGVPAQCMMCNDVGAGNGQYGPNYEWDGTQVSDPACDCIEVVAERCNREDITKNFGCMTIGGNDPQPNTDCFLEPIKKAPNDEVKAFQEQVNSLEEKLTKKEWNRINEIYSNQASIVPITESDKQLMEKIELSDMGTIWCVIQTTPSSAPYIPNYAPKDCIAKNWKCWCPRNQVYGGNNGFPSTHHPHYCLQTDEPLGTNSAVFATWTECHDVYACRYEPNMNIMSNPNSKKSGDCHIDRSGRHSCDNQEPASQMSLPGLGKGDVEMPNIPGMDIDTSTSAVPGLDLDIPGSDVPSTDRAISESKKIRKALKNLILKEIKKRK